MTKETHKRPSDSVAVSKSHDMFAKINRRSISIPQSCCISTARGEKARTEAPDEKLSAHAKNSRPRMRCSA